MPKVTWVEWWMAIAYPPSCPHAKRVPVRVQLHPTFDVAALSAALAVGPAHCSDCERPEIYASPKQRFVYIARLDCGHRAQTGVPFEKSELVASLARMRIGVEVSCSECSSDKALDLEKSNAVDMDSATKRYHETIQKAVDEGELTLKPLAFLTNEEAADRPPAEEVAVSEAAVVQQATIGSIKIEVKI